MTKVTNDLAGNTQAGVSRSPSQILEGELSRGRASSYLILMISGRKKSDPDFMVSVVEMHSGSSLAKRLMSAA